MDLARLELDGPIGRLTLNRPEQRNALSIELISAVRGRVAELAAMRDEGPKVVVVEGAGKAFCAGMDLKAVLGDSAGAARLLADLAELTLELRALPAVLIARVHGAAIGGGCGLACVCDIAITHDEANVGFPEVDLSVCPAVVAPWVVRKAGPGRARQILLRGGLLTGAEGAALGLMDRSVPSIEDLDHAVRETAERVAQGGRRALAATKGLLNRLDGSDDAAIVREGARLSAEVLATAEAQSALRARLEGR